MKTVRFYDMMIENIGDDIVTRSSLSNDLILNLPEDFDLDYAFDILIEKTGHQIDGFSYEVLTAQNQTV